MPACYKCATQTTNSQCENCGATTSCTSCGVWLKGPFCTSCGTPVEEVAASVRGETPTPPAPRAGQAIGEFSSATWKSMQQRELPSWADSNPVQPPNDEFGGTFHWSFGAFRRNLVGIGILTLMLAIIGGVGGFLSFLIFYWGADSRFTFALMLGTILTTAILMFVSSWVIMAAARAWSQIVRGLEVNLAECLSIAGILPCFAVTALLAPVLTPLYPVAYPVLVISILFVVADGLSATAAIGRSLQLIFESARSFFRFLTVGIVMSITMYVTLFATFSLFSQLSVGAAKSTVVTSFTDQSQFFEAEMTISVIFGTVAIAAIGLVVLYAVFHALGLWTAALVRHRFGKPIGSVEPGAPGGAAASEPVGSSS